MSRTKIKTARNEYLSSSLIKTSAFKKGFNTKKRKKLTAEAKRSSLNGLQKDTFALAYSPLQPFGVVKEVF